MTRTADQNRDWWLRMAARYEREAATMRTAAKQADYSRRADAARTHAETYSPQPTP